MCKRLRAPGRGCSAPRGRRRAARGAPGRSAAGPATASRTAAPWSSRPPASRPLGGSTCVQLMLVHARTSRCYTAHAVPLQARTRPRSLVARARANGSLSLNALLRTGAGDEGAQAAALLLHGLALGLACLLGVRRRHGRRCLCLGAGCALRRRPRLCLLLLLLLCRILCLLPRVPGQKTSS